MSIGLLVRIDLQQLEILPVGGLEGVLVLPALGVMETVEINNHPFFVGVQFHPEFKSRPDRPHPLFSGLVKASLAYAKEA